MTIAFWLRLVAVLVAALGVFPLANVLTAGAAVAWWDVVAREWVVRGGMVLAAAGVTAFAAGHRVDAVLARARALLMQPSSRAFGVGAAAVASLLALGAAWYCFSGKPFTSDEMAHQWHARILLAGRLYAVPEAWPEFFNTAPVWDRDGRWFSQYPIGGPAFTALGLAFGAAWIVNPLLIGVATWQLNGFLERTFGAAVARLTTVLFVVSPMVLIMAGSQMNHVPTLALALIALNALARWDATLPGPARDRLGSAAIVGLGIGVMATVRPLDAFIVAVVVGCFQLWRSAQDRTRFGSLALQIAVGAVPIAVLLWANARTTGHPLQFAYDVLNGPEHAIGFHMDPNGQMHTPARGLVYASGYLLRLGRYLFEWPLPATAFIVIGLATIRRPTRWDALLVALAVGFLLGYAAYWFDGFFSGPRFLFTVVFAFVYFTVRGVGAFTHIARPWARRSLLLVVPLCVLAAWLVPNGQSSVWARAAIYREQRTKLKTDVEEQTARAGVTNALVFVNEGWRGRLLARLRVLGASAFRAERIVNEVDACALGAALDDAERLVGLPSRQRLDAVVQRARSAGEARRVPDLPADQAVAIVPGSTPSAECLAEFRSAIVGPMPYPPFLPLHHLDEQGRIAGDIVFARDLGARNERLRARFGDRAWYRYRPAHSLDDDTTDVFVPYSP